MEKSTSTYESKPNKGALFARGSDKANPELFHYSGHLNIEGVRFDLSADAHIGSGSGQPLDVMLKRRNASPFDDTGLTVKLTRNDNKRNDRSPDYSGAFSLGDDKYSLVGWLQVPQAGGKKYLSLKVRSVESEQWNPADDSIEDPLFG